MTALGHLVASVLCQVAAGDAGLPCGPQLEILTALPHLRILHFGSKTVIRNDGVGGSNPSCGTKQIKDLATVAR